LGCDIGGTFTDFVLVNNESGEFYINKCLTTPKDPSDAVEEGIRGLLERVPGFVKQVDEFIHGTTLVINAIIERKGAKTGLITTKGFRDVLELGREIRYDAYDIFSEYPKPLVPRSLRAEVSERITADGRVIVQLKPEEVKSVLKGLRQSGIESLAICLIHSYENPVHEIQIKEIVNREAPELSLSISYEVLPQIREYERSCTTATNAYVKPITGKYLTKLSARLQSLGFTGKLLNRTRISGQDHRIRAYGRGNCFTALREDVSDQRYVLLRYGRDHRKIMFDSKRSGRGGVHL